MNTDNKIEAFEAKCLPYFGPILTALAPRFLLKTHRTNQSHVLGFYAQSGRPKCPVQLFPQETFHTHNSRVTAIMLLYSVFIHLQHSCDFNCWMS